MTINLYAEAKWIAEHALEIADGDFEKAGDHIGEICDSHEAFIYYGKAWELTANNDTHNAEDFLEDCGGIAHPGDSLGQIICRVAWAMLYFSAHEVLADMQTEAAQ